MPPLTTPGAFSPRTTRSDSRSVSSVSSVDHPPLPHGSAPVSASLTPRLRRLSLGIFSLWFGAGVGVAFIAIPVVFGPGIKDALPPGEAGRVAQSILLRFFQWQLGFAVLAGVLYGFERVQSADAGRWRAWILPPVFILSLLSLFWMHPRLARMHRERYAPGTPEPRRQELAARFGPSHGISQMINLAVLGGVLAGGYDLTRKRTGTS